VNARLARGTKYILGRREIIKFSFLHATYSRTTYTQRIISATL